MADDETRDLHAEQAHRVAREDELADGSERPSEEAEHRRRADKARYLEEKLEERAQSEREE